MRAFLLLLIAAATPACSPSSDTSGAAGVGGGSPRGGTGGVPIGGVGGSAGAFGPDAATRQNASCAPDKPFCSNNQVRVCTNDGQTSILKIDCPATVGGAFPMCAVCDQAGATQGQPVCKSASPYCQASISGVGTLMDPLIS